MSNLNKKFVFFSSVGRDNDEVPIYRQANCLKDNGYNVTFVVYDDKPTEVINGIEVQSVGKKQGGYLKRIFITPILMYSKLRNLNADIYQTTCPDYIFICLLLKLKRKKIIFNLRESHPYTYYMKSSLPTIVKKIIVSIMAFYMKNALRNFNAVFTVADDIMSYLAKWNIKRRYLIGNFPLVNPNHNVSFEEYNSRTDCILYFGSIYKCSCQQEMLNALYRIKNKNIKYLLAGKFHDKPFYEELKKHPIWNEVEFINGFKHSELDDFFSRSTISNVLRDFSVLSNKNGSLGIIKIFESMEAGLPIICSDVPVYREMMKEYKCGILVNPKNESQIQDAILYLINHKKEAWEMGQNGRRAVVEKYSWNAHSKIYLDIVNSCLDNK